VDEDEEENYCHEERDQREAQVLQGNGRACEYERAHQDCERPSEAPGEPPVSQAEGPLRDSAGQSPDRSGSGKRLPLVQCEEESDRPGRQWQAYEPAANSRPPASASQAGGTDQCRRKYELQSQSVHELIRPFNVLILQMGMWRMDRHGPPFKISAGVVSCPLQSLARRLILVVAMFFSKGMSFFIFLRLFFWLRIARKQSLCAKNVILNNIISHQHNL
jgi:hypothetical protein